MSKLTLIKKVIEYQHVFRSEFLIRKEVHDEIQKNISYNKYELQNSIEDNIMGRRKKGEFILVAW